MKIGVFDSGKGGTTVLEAIKRKLPDEEYLYIGDSENCPYGEKTDEKLKKIVYDIVMQLKNSGADVIVIACNTATTRCIDYLRATFPDTVFVGTEPAINLAVKKNAKRILVLATPGTSKSERLLLMIEQNKTDQIIDVLACPGLADAVEKDQDVDKVLHSLLDDVSKDYDVIVLGCTHYSLIKEKIQEFFPGSELIDGNEGVVNRVVELVGD